ncbi:MAG TPA: pyridoxamine 5'-phosphate oxidase family protein [Virgibacillus sp.]|nr:pyridoxamine 5'-phosphate oxidase family protein [Virgibacillus sp.]
MNSIKLESYRQKYLDFLKSRHTAVLNFIDADGKPFSSTAPFVQHNHRFYIYISEVAEHFQLMQTNEVVDVLMLADQADSNNPFATERVRYRCQPAYLGNDGFDDIFKLFDELYNQKMMKVFRGLDFSLFELTPLEGRYVVGFGLAFDLTVDGETFEHVVVDKESVNKEEKTNDT